jgi:hypothetical protein
MKLVFFGVFGKITVFGVFGLFGVFGVFDDIESYRHHVVHDCIIVYTTLTMFITHQKWVFLGVSRNRRKWAFLGVFGCLQNSRFLGLLSPFGFFRIQHERVCSCRLGV